MKILHISATGPETGAGSAAMKLHLSLRKSGIDSQILFLIGPDDPPQGVYRYAGNLLRKARRFITTQLDRMPLFRYPKRKRIIFSPGLFGIPLRDHELVVFADIVHLHWVNHGFLQIGELSALNKPIVWTMHDMWAFTGGCHHSFECTRYMERCGNCPALGSENKKDISRNILERKIKLMPVDWIKWVAISSWMSEMASASKLLSDQPNTIIYSGVDADVFLPVDKAVARRSFGFDPEKKIVLLGAQNVLSPYKGIQYSLDALSRMPDDFMVVTFGNGTLTSRQVQHEVINMGFISDPRKMACLYSAADVFLATSVAEGFGMTLAEAQLCATPVVAFDSTGPKDIVNHKNTGYLAQTKDVEDVISGIRYCLATEFSPIHIREWALRFSLQKSTEAYIDLYQSTLADVVYG